MKQKKSLTTNMINIAVFKFLFTLALSFQLKRGNIPQPKRLYFKDSACAMSSKAKNGLPEISQGKYEIKDVLTHKKITN